jgi:hypothetical protein
MPANWTMTLTAEDLAKGLQPAFESKCKKLHTNFRVTIESPIFAWNSVTRRKSGEIVSDPRDAVDTGKLRDSQTLTFLKPGLAEIKWRVPYAKNVFDHAFEEIIPFTLERLK